MRRTAENRPHTLLAWEAEEPLLRRAGLANASHLLDIGCGPGYIAGEILSGFPEIRVVGLDLDRELLRFARRETDEFDARVSFVEALAESCPFARDTFDLVLARYTFQHLADPVAVAREALRVLKPGGRVVVVDINAVDESIRAAGGRNVRVERFQLGEIVGFVTSAR
jgi:ubiquinone/menaquinone biosynthesis C-methylase UbiE